MTRRLTERQTQFVNEYLVDSNATRAAKAAGYSPSNAAPEGSRLLKNPLVLGLLKVLETDRTRSSPAAHAKPARAVYQIDGQVVSRTEYFNLTKPTVPEGFVSERELVVKFKLSRARLRELRTHEGLQTFQLGPRWYYSRTEVVPFV